MQQCQKMTKGRILCVFLCLVPCTTLGSYGGRLAGEAVGGTVSSAYHETVGAGSMGLLSGFLLGLVLLKQWRITTRRQWLVVMLCALPAAVVAGCIGYAMRDMPSRAVSAGGIYQSLGGGIGAGVGAMLNLVIWRRIAPARPQPTL